MGSVKSNNDGTVTTDLGTFRERPWSKIGEVFYDSKTKRHEMEFQSRRCKVEIRVEFYGLRQKWAISAQRQTDDFIFSADTHLMENLTFDSAREIGMKLVNQIMEKPQ